MNLVDQLSGRDNALNFVRMLMAGAVIVSHAWPLGGFGPDPSFGGLSLGRWAVASFFAISGYLIAASRLRVPFRLFMRRRIHRILPGLWFALLLTALLIAPVTAWVQGEDYHLGSGLAYALLNSFTLYVANGIPGTLQSAPIDAWNGSLGTLQFEMTMYLLVGLLLGSVHVRRFPRAVAAGALILMTGIQLGLAWKDVRGGLLMDFTHFGSFFAAGVFLRSQGTRARLSGPLVVIGALVLLGLCLFDLAGLLGALPIAYLVLALGAALPIRWGAVNDYSYGTYIFAFPVQQLLTVVGVPSWGVLAYIMVSAAATAPLAIASWWLVERPALDMLKRSLATATQPLTTQPTVPRHSTVSTATVALSQERGS